jgi:hypothetical protein
LPTHSPTVFALFQMPRMEPPGDGALFTNF